MSTKTVLDEAGLARLIDALRDDGYQVIGPTVRDGAVVYDEISSTADLPRGWTDEQGPGTYRLHPRQDAALFGYAVGPHSWKRFLFPPRTVMWNARRTDESFSVEEPEADPPRFAFIGVRACELRAIEIQDRVFINNGHSDPTYAGRRRNAFIVAVNCGEPTGTCFCVSMQTGPKATSGFDISLTEVLDGDDHYFVAESGSDKGSDLLEAIPHRSALVREETAAEAVVEGAADRMGRALEAGGVRELLARNADSPRWDDVASRCLACGNCTMVCPTCFCSSVDDATDLTGEQAEHARRWDSCFTLDFSALGSGSVRSSTNARYRQWLTHKFSTWFDQFDTPGCVGCGRCITWCPVGIDVTAEITAIRAIAATAPQEA